MTILDAINDFLWTYIVIGLLVGSALYFTVRTRFMQLRLLGDMIGMLFRREKRSGIGAFQAFAVALSSRVGTGNLAGVASAIFVGGPGAVFWMWVMALLGAATAFIESTLAQLYKRRGRDSFYGGPAYYMTHGLHARWMGVLFAILITATFGMANQVVQSTTLCDALADVFATSKPLVGVLVTISIFIIIFGGIRRISHVASLMVPFMAVGYLVLALVVVAMNLSAVPHVLRLIVDSAFGFDAAAGGAIGTTIMQGVKRGLFSNEAGEGSAPNAAAIADTSHPVKQGLLQALGVFIDTLVCCSATAFIVLLSGKYHCDKDGIMLTTEALQSEVGSFGRYYISAAIFLFAYTTIIANYFYGETNIRFFTQRKWAVTLFRILTAGVVMYGAMVELQTAFSFADLAMGLMTLTNLVAILLLSPRAFRLLRHYCDQRGKGRDPEFHRSDMPDLADDIECWE